MSARRYLVVELKDNLDLGEIVTFVSNKSTRLAVVGAVPGIFDSPVAPLLPQREVTLPTRKRVRVNVEDVAQPESQVPQSDDIAAQVDHPSDDLDSEANIDVMTVERNPMNTSLLEKSTSEEGSSAGVLNITNVSVDETEGVKENMMRFFEHGLEDEEFLDASEALPRKSGRKRRRRLGAGSGDYDVYSTRRKSRTAEETLHCGLCNSSMTLRASYGRTRLREHVLRHLNLPTAMCGTCGFQGVLREHIRRHHSLKHADEQLHCVDMEMTEEFNDKFETLWKTCFPETKKIPPRSNYKRLIEGIMDTSGHNTSFPKTEDAPSDSVNDTMEALMHSLANGNRIQMSDGELHEDDGDEENVRNETVDVKPDMAHLSAAVEDLVNESMTTHPPQ